MQKALMPLFLLKVTNKPPSNMVHNLFLEEYNHSKESIHMLFQTHHHHIHCYLDPMNNP